MVSENYFPGWTAKVGEADVPIVQTDALLRGVPVPAGEHLVTMRFRPETHRASLTVSWVAFLIAYGGVLALGGLLWYRRGHPAK